MELRLQKYLADAGIASRRKAEELILAGKVIVNSKVVRELGTKVDPQKDTVLFEGKPVSVQGNMVYIMLHKPEGFVTTSKDQFGRPAVLDLIKGVSERIFPVGRLDYDTSGLLLLTNDGDLTFRLTHPKHDIEKEYEAKVFGIPDQADIYEFNKGVLIDGKRTKPAKLMVLEKGEKYANVKIIISEGRNRQVRKMCKEVKHPVAMLKRTATGELSLGDLQKGKWRYLTDKEVAYLKKL